MEKIIYLPWLGEKKKLYSLKINLNKNNSKPVWRRLQKFTIRNKKDLNTGRDSTFLGRKVMSDSLQLHGRYSPWNSPGQNTAVGSRSLLQEIFPTRESNPGLPYCRWILYHLNHQESPRILQWVAYPFSSSSSWPRNWTGVSCIAGRFFTSWATRAALK